jgi:hypothetical protein
VLKFVEIQVIDPASLLKGQAKLKVVQCRHPIPLSETDRRLYIIPSESVIDRPIWWNNQKHCWYQSPAEHWSWLYISICNWSNPSTKTLVSSADSAFKLLSGWSLGSLIIRTEGLICLLIKRRSAMLAPKPQEHRKDCFNPAKFRINKCNAEVTGDYKWCLNLGVLLVFGTLVDRLF